MKNRSLGKLAVYFLVSLGVYELFWFAQTRQEMMALTDVRIPRVRWIVVLRLFNIIGLVVAVWAILSLSSSGNQGVISTTCWRAYMLSTASEDVKQDFANAGGSTAYTPACQKEVANSNRVDRDQEIYVSTIIVMLVGLCGATLIFCRWLNYYTAAVAKVTRGKLSHTQAMFYLGMLPNGVGMLLVQDTFNNPENQPAGASTVPDNEVVPSVPYQETAQFPRIKKALLVVIFVLILIVVAGIAGIYLSAR